MDEFIEVPIHKDFDACQLIGSVKILKSEMPDRPDWCLALGIKVEEVDFEKGEMDYELMAMGMIKDDKLLSFDKIINGDKEGEA